MIKIKQIKLKHLKWVLRVVAVAMPFAGIRIGYSMVGWSFTSDSNIFNGFLSLMLGVIICSIGVIGVWYAIKYIFDEFPRFLDWLFTD